MGRFIVILIACMLAATVAHAEDRTISWDNGMCDVFDFSQIKGHFIDTPLPQDWGRTFTQSLTFYGKTYGDVGELRATVVVLGPQGAGTATLEDAPDAPVIYARKQFRIADVAGPDGGWVTIDLDPVELAPGCMAGIFTYSNEERGLMIGLAPPDEGPSHSSYVETVAVDDGAYLITPRTDGRDWMIRLTVRPTLEVHSAYGSGDLTGPSFSAYDDGVADGFTTLQKYGPVLRIKNSGARKVKRVWIYAYIDGDWFNTTRDAAVYLMDQRYAIVRNGHIGYARYTEQPAWNYVAFDNISVPKEFLVLVEPFSRPGLNFMIGYDNSGENRGSEFGSVGHAELGWPLEIPEDTTNWMIRVEYAD